MKRFVVAVSFLFVVLAGTGCQRSPANPTAAIIDHSKFYAVLLSNGSVYFGHVDGLGSDFPVLTDVYYVQSNVNQETKAVNNALVKRGKEWHGPDRMIINGKSIVFLEPVGSDSRVAMLIAESKK